MSQLTLRRSVLRFGLLQIAIILLAIVTGFIHLDKALTMGLLASHTGGAPAGGHPAGRLPAGHAGGPSGPMLLIFQNLPLLFILNFIGYIVLVVALYLPFLKQFQRAIRWVLIVFTAITIIAYFALLGFSPNPLGYADKVVELALLALLVIEDRKAARLANE